MWAFLFSKDEVDVIFEQRIKSRLRFPKFKKIQNSKFKTGSDQDLISL